MTEINESKDDFRISPAVLTALADGDLINALVAATPGGIERQEAEGQRALVASQRLPLDMRDNTREQFEALGIRFGQQVDDIFIKAELPAGWRKVTHEHAMHSDVVDGQGRLRIHMFYKAAFYDRRADMTITPFYQLYTRPVGGWSDDWNADYEKPWEGTIEGGGEVVFRTEPQMLGEEINEQLAVKHDLSQQCADWLREHAPDWHDPLAYWEEDPEHRVASVRDG